jgi:hypothetical protein
MAKLYRLNEISPSSRTTFFDRSELGQLLSLYSRQVANGQWRDYAIDQQGGSVVFSVFRHTHDAPAFRIAKQPARGAAGSAAGNAYIVSSGAETLIQANTMTEALSVFGGSLRVVS